MFNLKQKYILLTTLTSPLLLLIFSISKNPWFIFRDSLLYIILSSIGLLCILIFAYMHNKQPKKINRYINSLEYSNVLSFALPIMMALLFIYLPLRNLNLGDGILLLENMEFETRIFGFQLTMDELLEALLHSRLYAFMNLTEPDPILPYRILSVAGGILFLIAMEYFFKKEKMSNFSRLAIYSSGGMLLFHGYAENYTFVTLIIFIYSIYAYEKIKSGNRELIDVLIIAFILSISFLTHLVSGYLIFSAIYACFALSQKKDFIRNSFYSATIAGVLIIPIFSYYLFFSEVRFDLFQTHATNPKFYPLRKIISTAHFKDILLCIFFTSLPAFSIFTSYLFIKFRSGFFKRLIGSIKEWKNTILHEKLIVAIKIIISNLFLKLKLKLSLIKEENLFLGLVLFGFSLHGFIHNPQLGFPADWDLMSFFWIPLSLITAILLSEIQVSKAFIVPILIFSFLFYALSAYNLSYPSAAKEKELQKDLMHVKAFVQKNSLRLAELKPENRKPYAKLVYFLYKTRETLKSNIDTSSRELLEENSNFYLELEENKFKFEKIWYKDFLKRLTDYHIRYLNTLKVNATDRHL